MRYVRASMKNGRILHQPLAVVGFACRLPGAESTGDFWDLIRKGRSAFADLPHDRLDRSLYFVPEKGTEGKTYTTLAGIVEAPATDSRLCEEPQSYDPSHLIFLHVAAEACRDAGWDPLNLPLRNTGVYVGHARTGLLLSQIVYAIHIEQIVHALSGLPAFTRLPRARQSEIVDAVIKEVRSKKPHRRMGGKPFTDPAMAAALVSQTLGLTGPYMAIDAACSSSLVALAIAAVPLQEGRIDMAIVGGASYSNWQSMVLFSRAQALSAVGSFPFDVRADGFVSSDGYAAIIVKTLSRALADGDRIHALIRGIGLSSDGRGKSLWAPRKQGQIEAIQRAYDGELDPAQIQYIEAHGTSTPLGDSTELQSLATVLSPLLSPGQKIPIASVKGNIGHTCETAGLAGLIKTILAMKNGVVPPAANFSSLNPEIDLRKLPFFIPTEALPWPARADGKPRRAAVDAFGIGGLNVHLVVDEFLAQSVVEPKSSKEDKIAIIGAGCIFPRACTAESFWEMLQSGRDPKSPAPAQRWNSEIYWDPQARGPWRSIERSGGFITDFELDPGRFRIPPRQLETADPLQYMVLDAADQALRDAGYGDKPFDRRRTAVVIGTMFSSDFQRHLSLALQYPEFERDLEFQLVKKQTPESQVRQILEETRKDFFHDKPMLKDETGSFSSSTLASRVARTLDLMGGAFSVDAEEASSGAALESAMDLLRSGACDLVLCGGAQRSMDIDAYEDYSLRGMLGAGGFLPAEGAGIFLLKRLEDAQRDGDRIRGVITESRAGVTGASGALDPATRQIGHALGASGAASLLAAIAPGAGTGSKVLTSSSRGLSFEFQVENQGLRQRPRVAFLFPGQGSQYTGMVSELAREAPAAAARIRQIDAEMARLGYRSFAEIAWQENNRMGTDPWHTQVAMLLADLVVFAVLQDLGLQPDVVAGHSYGEFPALVASGAWTLEQAIRATQARVELLKTSVAASCFLMATSAPPESAARLVAGSEAHIAIRNAPDQTVVGGTRECLEDLKSKFIRGGFQASLLPLPGAFHTPLFSDICLPFRSALAGLEIMPPRIPILSSVTLRYVADPDEIRQNLAVQPMTPLDYPKLVRRLAEDGVSVFIEVGPQQVLTRLNRSILREAATAIACDQANAGMAPILQAAALLEKVGLHATNHAEPSSVPLKSRNHEILYFDASSRRRMKNKRRGKEDPAPDSEIPETMSAPGDGKEDEWESFLIHFICEQTGYAPEVIDLDADLDADLGIDSIKKMQLFGELRERFHFSSLQPSAFAGFSTLRHFLEFLKKNAQPAPASSSADPDRAEMTTADIAVLKLRGSPYEMGREHGRRQATQIQSIIGRYCEVLGGDIRERTDLKNLMENLVSYFGDSGIEELRGLADGSDMPLDLIAGFNAALMPSLMPGCSHFGLNRSDSGAADILHGANEDAPLTMMLGIPLKPIAMARHPKGRIPHLTFGLPGQFAGLNGINASGLAISSTLLLDKARATTIPGKTHCALVKEILEEADSIQAAVDRIRGARRLGAWAVLLSHGTARDMCYIEYDESSVEMMPLGDRIVGANHSLLRADPDKTPAHSRQRLARLSALIDPEREGTCTVEQAQTALRDCYDETLGIRASKPTMNTVRRVDNLMSLVMRPTSRDVWVAPGIRAESYQKLDVERLLEPRVMRRWVLRMIEAPLSLDSAAPQFSGAALVIGKNAAAQALSAHLAGRGVQVIGDAEKDPPAHFMQSPEGASVRHLFLMCGRDEQKPDLMGIFELCRRWIESLRQNGGTGGATLVAATSLGGDFGFTGRILSAEGGGIAGLLKAIRRECPDIKIKVVDAPRKEPAGRLAAQIIAELGADSPEIEVGYQLGRRLKVCLMERPAIPRAPIRITGGGIWIATGGSSGVTACAARAIVEKFKVRMHVLGRAESAQLDYPADYHCCDISNERTLQSVVEKIRKECGPIRGIIHGAGVESAARFEKKDLALARATIASKACGANLLMSLTRQDPLEAFLAFGSVSGRFGGHGQTDYALANEWLAKSIQRFRLERPECRSVAFLWPAWDEVGMAMRPDSRLAIAMAGQSFMPVSEGLNHMLVELEAGAPEGEVLFIDNPEMLDPDCCVYRAETGFPSGPLIEGKLLAAPGKTVVEIRLDPQADPFIREHRFRGWPLLPAAAALEALAEAALVALPENPAVSLRNVEISNGLHFSGKGSWRTKVEICGAECRLLVDFCSRDGRLVEHDRVLVTAELAPDDSGIPQYPAVIPEKWDPVHYPEEGPILHGAAYQCLKEIAFTEMEVFGRILAQSPAEIGGPRSGAWLLPIAELDSCLVACSGYAWKQWNVFSLPRRLDRFRLFRLPQVGESCLVHIRICERTEALLRFDLALFGSDRSPILEVRGFEAGIVPREIDNDRP